MGAPVQGSLTVKEDPAIKGEISRTVKKEKDYLYKDELACTIDKLPKEKILPPPNTLPDIPQFGDHHFRPYGNTILLVIPTENDDKMKILKEIFERKKLAGDKLHFIMIKADSDVGEQPYDWAGVAGACNRIRNALGMLATPGQKYVDFEKEKIGTVIVGSIENYIQKTNFEGVDNFRRADYGAIVLHNVTTKQTVAGFSEGVTAPPPYLDHTLTFQFEDPDRLHGKETLGEVLEINVPGIKKGDWHEVVVDKSRFEFLREAIDKLTLPW